MDHLFVLLDCCFYQNGDVKKIVQILPNTKILILSNYTEKCFFEKRYIRLISYFPDPSCAFPMKQEWHKDCLKKSHFELIF